jgi:quinol-cytochrome oxidoreductase complex cytochrome b subunit
VLLFFFFFKYLHMFRGLYYCCFLFDRQLLCNSGFILFILMFLTAFLGYVLP